MKRKNSNKKIVTTMVEPDYIANCIFWILSARCDKSKTRVREKDLAEAIRIAASKGEAGAHAHLQSLISEIETGRYEISSSELKPRLAKAR